MAVSAGTAALQVVPTLAKDFSRELATKMGGPAVKTANKTGTDAGRTFGRRFGRTVSDETGKSGEKHGRRFGASFSGGIRTGVGPVKGILRGFGPGLAAAFGGAAIVAGIKSVVDEAREAAVVGKQTAAVLKSTGGAANISAKQVGDLATALSNKSGVDDEVIQTSQNLLLTFTGIRNEVGKGNDIFNQSSTAIVDMTAAMNGGQVTAQGLKASTIQVGKALNDPIKGMTALSRVGVTFNQQQKDQIKTLVESGDKLGAQKIILAELRKEFGGSAAASADAGKRFGVFIGNLKEQIGTVLLPVLNRVLSFLVDKLPGALTSIGGFFRTAGLGVRALVAAFKEGDVTSDGFVGVMERIGVAVRQVWGTLVRLLVPAFKSIAASVVPAAKAFGSALLPGLKSLWHVVQTQVLPALKIVAAIIGVTLFAALKYVLPLLLRIAGPVLGFFFKQLGQTIQWISNLVRWVGRVLAWLARWVTGTKTTGDAIRELGRRVGVFASNMAKQWHSITTSVGNALSGLRRVTITVLSAMIRFWLRWAGNIVDAAATALGWIPGIGPKIRTAQAKFHEFAASVNRSLDRIKDKNVDVKATAHVVTTNQTRQALNALGIKGYGTKFLAVGGPVRGPGTGTSDSIPAMLSAGEHVWTAKEVRKAGGHEAVEGMRQQVTRGYAGGGPVLDVPTKLTNNARGILERFYHPAVAGISRLGQRVADKLAALAGKGLAKAMDKASFGGNAGIKAFIRSLDSHPYVWGGAGPGGYDCSGITGAVYGKMTGRGGGHGQRYFTTSTIGGMGFARGPGGVLQIGVTPGHHMAGRYGGLGFEAESSRTGIKIGAAASPPWSFPVQYHLAQGGRVKAAKELARLGIEVGGDPGGMWLRKDKSIGIFDRGGTLQPGLNLVANRTGRDEPLIPAAGGGGIDYDKLGRAVAVALAQHPPRAYLDPNQARQGIREAQRHGGVPKREQLR